MSTMKHLTLHPGALTRPILNPPSSTPAPDPHPKQTKTVSDLSTTGTRQSVPGGSLHFIGTATTLLSYGGLRILTDPNFLHAGDHVHLGPGVSGTRRTNPTLDLEDLPPIDLILLSHYHEDHFDREVEGRLRRDIPIVSTPHAVSHLEKEEGVEKGVLVKGGFQQLTSLDHWESALVRIAAEGEVKEGGDAKTIKITGVPGKHVPPGPAGVMEKVNDFLAAVPPTNGWMVELGSTSSSSDDSTFKTGYRIYITGDTLLIDELKDIPRRYSNAGAPIDLMLMHLGGTTIPGPSMPLLMVTMDAEQGVQLIKLVDPRTTIPIHMDDYDVFLSGVEDFKKAVEREGLSEKVVFLDRGEEYQFMIKG